MVTFVKNTLSNNYITMANQYGMELEDLLSYICLLYTSRCV